MPTTMLFRLRPLSRLGFSLLATCVVAQAFQSLDSVRAEPVSARPFLVQLRTANAPEPAVRAMESGFGVRARRIYRHALRGFAADLGPAQVRALRNDPRVLAIQEDRIVALVPPSQQVRQMTAAAARVQQQVIPTGIRRCGADRSITAKINGVEDLMDVDVAVVDTGIDSKHPDLNVVGGVSFVSGSKEDPNGHGTHVAGIIAARDNGFGVVGVAPGARLWSVRVLNRKGFGSWSDIIDGLDWIAARADQIEVANLSLSDDLGADNVIVQAAFDGLVAAGVTVVAAAGNADASGPKQASLAIPGRYESVIGVSALADNDGAAGASTGIFRVKRTYYERDESYADFSNFGPAVDLIAPGVAILSTYKGRKYAEISGTSQAAPHVSGAAALYLRTHPAATPAQVRAALMAAGTTFEPIDAPDSYHEPALNTSGL